jgi:DNA-binding MarR family transcriptional regulator
VHPRPTVFLTAWTAAQRIEQLMINELVAADALTPHFALLSMIRIREPVTPKALAAETGLPGATLSDRLRDLVELGHVRRRPNPRDGRSYLIATTAAGRRAADRGGAVVVRARAALGDELRIPLAEVEKTIEELNVALDSLLELQAAQREPSRRQRYA